MILAYTNVFLLATNVIVQMVLTNVMNWAKAAYCVVVMNNPVVQKQMVQNIVVMVNVVMIVAV
jgi:hypothetical protein